MASKERSDGRSLIPCRAETGSHYVVLENGMAANQLVEVVIRALHLGAQRGLSMSLVEMGMAQPETWRVQMEGAG